MWNQQNQQQPGFGQHQQSGFSQQRTQYANYHQSGQLPNQSMAGRPYQQTGQVNQPPGQYQGAPSYNTTAGHQSYQQHGQAGSYQQQSYGRPQQHTGHMQYQPGQAGPMMGGNRPPPPGIDPTLWGWFQSVDRDNSGNITSDELRQALLNNNWSHFNMETCRLMIGMFDKDRSGTINIYEFAALWKYIQDWKACFDGFDADKSGTIDERELSQAFTTFGYRLSPQFCSLCVRVFDRSNVRTMKFDDFIQCCVMLKTLTDAFRKYDTNQTGVININYEQFMDMVLNNTLSGI